jgi:FtsZ-binding cell division protein ZapB
MKERIKRFLIVRNIKLIAKIVKYKAEIGDLKEKINKLELDKKDLKEINYNISCNNEYLIAQKRKYNKKLRQLKIELEEFKKEKGKKDERKN